MPQPRTRLSHTPAYPAGPSRLPPPPSRALVQSQSDSARPVGRAGLLLAVAGAMFIQAGGGSVPLAFNIGVGVIALGARCASLSSSRCRRARALTAPCGPSREPGILSRRNVSYCFGRVFASVLAHGLAAFSRPRCIAAPPEARVPFSEGRRRRRGPQAPSPPLCTT